MMSISDQTDSNKPNLRTMTIQTLNEKYIPVLFKLVRSTDIDSSTYYSLMKDLKATSEDYSSMATPWNPIQH